MAENDMLSDSRSALRVSTYEAWRAAVQSDTTANDSDKSFTVPSDQEWQVHAVYVKMVDSATVGNRRIAVQVQYPSGTVIAQIRAGTTQAASETRYYQFSPPMPDLTSFRDTDLLLTPLPVSFLPPASVLRVYDHAAIDPTVDDMDVHVVYSYRRI